MARFTRKTARVAVAVGAVAGLVGAGGGGAFAAPHVRDAHARATTAATPSLTGKIANGKFTVTGDRTFPAGRLGLTVSSPDRETQVAVVRLAPGFSWSDLRADIKAFGQSFGPNGPSKAGLRHLNHAINHATLYGGLDIPQGQTRRATLLIRQQAGTYYIYNDSGQLPSEPRKLTVTAPAGPQTLARPLAHVVAKTTRRFGGDTELPADGDVVFKNISTESPHFLGLIHVKEGTTRKQVIDAFSGNSQPTFFRQGQAGTDALSTNQSQTLFLHLPKGEYAEFCFFPDPKTGMPHALMGMVRIVHLI